MKKILFFIVILECGLCVRAQSGITLPEKPHRAGYTDYATKDMGYWGAIEATGGTTVMFKRHNLPLGSFSIINGFRLNEFLRAGVGFGVKYYVNNDDVRSSSIPWTFPLYADIRGNIISQESRSVVPYWSFDIGAEIRDGFFFSPTIGIRLGEKRSSFLIGLSYSYNQIKNKKDKYEDRSILQLRLGYEF